MTGALWRHHPATTLTGSSCHVFSIHFRSDRWRHRHVTGYPAPWRNNAGDDNNDDGNNRERDGVVWRGGRGVELRRLVADLGPADAYWYTMAMTADTHALPAVCLYVPHRYVIAAWVAQPGRLLWRDVLLIARSMLVQRGPGDNGPANNRLNWHGSRVRKIDA